MAPNDPNSNKIIDINKLREKRAANPKRMNGASKFGKPPQKPKVKFTGKMFNYIQFIIFLAAVAYFMRLCSH